MIEIEAKSHTGFQSFLLLAFVATCSLCATGCMNSNDDDDDSGGGSTPSAVRLFVANNGTSDVGDIDEFSEQFVAAGTFSGDTNEGLDIDIAGNMFGAIDGLQGGGAAKAGEEGEGKDGVAFDGGVDVLGGFSARSSGGSRDVRLDRRIGGLNNSNTQLQAPKGVTIAHSEGYLFVADFAAGNIKVFGTAAGGDVPPLAVATTSAPPWDLVFDEIFDDLYVTLTDGRVEVFEDFTTGFGMGGSDALIVPSDGVGQVSTNLHGIDYDFSLDQLFVTDVGVVSDAGDGAVYVIPGASSANGMVIPASTFAGPSTMLGNPVDCLLDGDDLYVAEKANGLLLRFDDVSFSGGGDVAPNMVLVESTPESLEGANPSPNVDPDVTDVDSTTTFLLGVATTSNPGIQVPPNPGFGEYVRLDGALTTELSTFPVGQHLENVVFDLTGDAFITFDDGTDQNGGIFVGNRLARSRSAQPAPTDSRDRMITGPSTQLASPKGIESAGALGLLLVADNDAAAPAIRAYGTQAHGDVPPVFSTDLLNSGRPWDLDYDPAGDRLFVALTNGTVAVFDDYSTAQGAAGPDRMITPSDGVGQISVNLHGIVYDGAADRLILSDVGSAADPTDGQIFVIPGGATANGMTPVSVRILGPATQLGNPVDIAFNGDNLYVAEKSNDMILRFDQIATSPGGDVAPSQSSMRIKPESVCVIPSYLSRTPGF